METAPYLRWIILNLAELIDQEFGSDLFLLQTFAVVDFLVPDIGQSRLQLPYRVVSLFDFLGALDLHLLDLEIQ